MNTNKEMNMKELDLNEMENVSGGEVICTGLIIAMGVVISYMTGFAIYEHTK